MDISLQVLLFIAVLILLAKATGGLGARVGLPVVLGELLAGVILGPTLVNVWRFSWFSSPAAVAGICRCRWPPSSKSSRNWASWS